jgi:hypothetical protein
VLRHRAVAIKACSVLIESEPGFGLLFGRVFFTRTSIHFARKRQKGLSSTERPTMAHHFAINENVHHQLQGPQGRADIKQRSIYTIVTCLPIEADGRPRYRIKSKTENVERVVTEEQISRLE